MVESGRWRFIFGGSGRGVAETATSGDVSPVTGGRGIGTKSALETEARIQE